MSVERRSLSVTGDGSEPILSCACNFISLFYGGEVKTNHNPTFSITVMLHVNEGFAFGRFVNGGLRELKPFPLSLSPSSLLPELRVLFVNQ